MSVEEMLAAARGNKAESTTGAKPEASSAAPSKPAAVDRSKMSVEEMLAAARGNKAAAATGAEPATSSSPAEKPAAVDRGKMSVEEMLAAARGDKPATAKTTEPAAAIEEPAVEDSSSEQGELPTETADILSFCRKVDG